MYIFHFFHFLLDSMIMTKPGQNNINNVWPNNIRRCSNCTSERVNSQKVLFNTGNIRHVENVQAPFQPFVDGEPKSVIILTYQRSGSSFFGQMFNTNPSAFYMFEPLDALYSALYGTSPGWNVPSDITSFWNGSQRSVFTLCHNHTHSKRFRRKS